MISTQEKMGFFAENSGWIRPLVAALILMIGPKTAQNFGGMSSEYLIPICSLAALVAVVFAGFKARMTHTLSAKIVSHLAVLTCLFLLAVQFFRSV